VLKVAFPDLPDIIILYAKRRKE
jgi:hypothetical protein